ncbi:hypothetical protein B0H66DRAFT_600551 [Apodospora peruviana]|uniref:J domain-containing protein n=1 Tax=Apodospora peruviana TaxID=516989 RepID=A0AAE0IJS1_9PEZI|nr:hypothetical protein B0H66DRAFT_600551 [Apodospora peruviana]
MPLRYNTPIGATALHRGLARLVYRHRPPVIKNPTSFGKLFHTSRILNAQVQDDTSKNHYETLNVHPDASASEIKKSFYTLSKRHHPDVNPSDPHASCRFMRISEAYSILGHTEKRANYDRDFLRRQPHHRHAAHHHHHKGSYHSTGPAGGRPASGLSSRRRGTFQGPPPSFFRSGGWGNQGAKRQAAHEDSTGSTDYNPQTNASSSSFGSGSSDSGGMGPGQRPYPRGRNENVPPHFDSVSHERTHRRVDERRAQQRRNRENATKDWSSSPWETETGMARGFFLVSGVLVVAVLGPYFAVLLWEGTTNWARGSGRKRRDD